MAEENMEADWVLSIQFPRVFDFSNLTTTQLKDSGLCFREALVMLQDAARTGRSLWPAVHVILDAFAFAFAFDLDVRDVKGKTPLYRALKDRKHKVVRHLIRFRAEVNGPISSGVCPLHKAASNGDKAMIKCLLQNGADIDVRDYDLKTPLHYAVFAHHSVSKLLLKGGANVDAKDINARTPLHTCCKTNNYDQFITLLEHGADANALDAYGRSPLHIIAQTKYRRGFSALLKFGAYVDIPDNQMKTPLHISCERNNRFVMEKLFRHGADPNARDKDGRTPLHSTLDADGDFKISKLLLMRRFLEIGGQKVDVNVPSSEGTPLHVACQRSYKENVKILVALGADVSALHPPVGGGEEGEEENNNNNSASKIKRSSPLCALIQSEADTWIIDNEKWDFANRKYDTLKHLLLHGAKVHWRGIEDGVEMPIVHAIRQGWEKCALLLLIHGSPTDFDLEGRSLLLLACKMGMQRLIEALFAVGCRADEREFAKSLLTFHRRRANSLLGRDAPNEMRNDLIRQSLEMMLSDMEIPDLTEPPSLFEIAVGTTLKCLSKSSNGSTLKRIEKLEIPDKIKSYLRFDHLELDSDLSNPCFEDDFQHICDLSLVTL